MNIRLVKPAPCGAIASSVFKCRITCSRNDAEEYVYSSSANTSIRSVSTLLLNQIVVRYASSPDSSSSTDEYSYEKRESLQSSVTYLEFSSQSVDRSLLSANRMTKSQARILRRSSLSVDRKESTWYRLRKTTICLKQFHCDWICSSPTNDTFLGKREKMILLISVIHSISERL